VLLAIRTCARASINGALGCRRLPCYPIAKPHLQSSSAPPAASVFIYGETPRHPLSSHAITASNQGCWARFHTRWQALLAPAMASTARVSSGLRKWHGRGCHRPRIITMLSVGQTVASRAYFACADELSRRRQWRTAMPIIFSSRTPPLLLHVLIRVIHLGSDGPERPVPLRWRFSQRAPRVLSNRTRRPRPVTKIQFS
jgi:hypothetical protein